MNTGSDFVSMNSKTEYYDSDKILSKWGFTDSQCHNCGISNSDINGLLMQCGKCRRAYYCSMKCFNEHLPEHNKYCGTKHIDCQPKGGEGVDVKFKKPKKQSSLKDEKPKKAKAKKAAKKQQQPPVEDVVAPPPPAEEEEEELELGDLLEDLKVTEPGPAPERSTMSQSFSHFGRGGKPRTIAEREAFAKEHVNLRHTELSKYEHSWMTPEWINAQLRKTERGRKLLEQDGDLSGPVTDIHRLIEEGYISWKKPEWTQPKLRKTPRGEAIKQEAIAHENSFKEERAHHSFSH